MSVLIFLEVAVDRVMLNTDALRIGNVKSLVATIAAVIVTRMVEAIKTKTEIVNSVINVIAIVANAAVAHAMTGPAMIGVEEAVIVIVMIEAIVVRENVVAAARQCNAMLIASEVVHGTDDDVVALGSSSANG